MIGPGGHAAIRELLADPGKFNEDGRVYDLLRFYVAGFPVETLRPLLRSEDPLVRRAAVFVASELGTAVDDLIDDVIPLLRSGDRHLAYPAMEILALCCDEDRAAGFAHVALQLESDDDVLRALAMRLISGADVAQLEAARRFLAGGERSRGPHQHGLGILAAQARVEPGILSAMIRDRDPLVRRYGAIAARRLLQRFPILMFDVAASDDADVRGVFQQAAETT